MRLIDADALITEINDRIDAAIKWGCNAIADGDKEIKLRAEQAVATFCEASLTVKKMPTIDPVKHGRWVKQTDENCWWYECSECGDYPMKNAYGHEELSAYCPHCGAIMEGDGEEDE